MADVAVTQGARDLLTDIDGLAVGHAHDDAARTGTTVILPDPPAVMAVDVRGGGPGTRETDALDPTCLVDRFHGLVLSGGSVFGLAAADGVVGWLSERGVGLPLGPRAVPVVPSAILFDLMNGGDKAWGQTPPYRALGRAAAEAAGGGDVALGRVGAAFGATAGDRPGGLGSASAVTADGLAVAALIAVNSFGPPTDQAGGHAVDPARIPLPKLGFVGANTTIGVVATNLALDKAAARRLAMMAQDGLARALRPVHTPFDGDTVFAIATGGHLPAEPLAATLTVAGAMAADCVVRAIDKGLKAAGAVPPD